MPLYYGMNVIIFEFLNIIMVNKIDAYHFNDMRDIFLV